jgi:hypothetical protein
MNKNTAMQENQENQENQQSEVMLENITSQFNDIFSQTELVEGGLKSNSANKLLVDYMTANKLTIAEANGFKALQVDFCESQYIISPLVLMAYGIYQLAKENKGELLMKGELLKLESGVLNQLQYTEKKRGYIEPREWDFIVQLGFHFPVKLSNGDIKADFVSLVGKEFLAILPEVYAVTEPRGLTASPVRDSATKICSLIFKQSKSTDLSAFDD